MDQNSLNQSCQELISLINEQVKERSRLRGQEKNLLLRERALASVPQVKNSTRNMLAQILPPHLMPQNVGDIDMVAWPFYYAFDLDFGDNPTLTNLSRQTAAIQVSQEAGFLLIGLSQNFQGETEAGPLGPYQITIRDNQSTRQFNDLSIPIQAIGSNSNPTVLDTPLLFYPNASITIEATTWLSSTESLVTVGSSQMQIMAYGVRIRLDDANSVLSTVFGSR